MDNEKTRLIYWDIYEKSENISFDFEKCRSVLIDLLEDLLLDTEPTADNYISNFKDNQLKAFIIIDYIEKLEKSINGLTDETAKINDSLVKECKKQ